MGHLVVHNENHTDVRDLRCVPVHEGYGKYVVDALDDHAVSDAVHRLVMTAQTPTAFKSGKPTQT
jgi:hypothetical protein